MIIGYPNPGPFSVGQDGLVPAPVEGNDNTFLNSNGTWTTVSTYTHPTATAYTSGLYKITVNSTGHITAASAITKDDITALGIPASDSDTHYVTKLIAGSSTASNNTSTTNGNTYLRLFDEDTVRSTIGIKGTGGTTVTSDANGIITINSSSGGSSVSITRNLTSGTKIGTITIDGTSTDLYCNTDTNTHNTAYLYAGASNGTTNASTTNGNTYLILADGSTYTRRKIYGSGATTVTSDASGNILISSTDTNTNTDTLVTQTVTTTASWYSILHKNATAVTTVTDTSRFSANLRTLASTGAVSNTGGYQVTLTGLTRGTTPSSNQAINVLTLYADGGINSTTESKRVSQVYGGVNTGNNSYLGICTYKPASSGTTNGSFFLWCNNDGGLNLSPGSTKTVSLGTSSSLWSQLYAGTTTISTSDERTKQDINNIDDKLLSAWEEIPLLSFKFNDAVEKKGFNNARIHSGTIAQRVQSVLEKHDIDASQYAFFCYDKWNAKDIETMTEVESEELDGYSIRYEEFLIVECAYLRSKIKALEEYIKG